MPLFFLSLEPGSDTYLYQETLYRSESCRRRLRKTALSRDGHSSSSSMSPTLLVFLHPLQVHLAAVLCTFSTCLSFMIGMPNRCGILELRANQCFVCISLVRLGAKAKLRRRKSNVLVALAEISEMC